MRYCIQCNKIETMCGCNYPHIVNSTTINSDQAGRDGLSAYESAIRTGVFSGTEAEYALWTKGQKGDPGKDGKDGLNGGGIYKKADW